MLVDHTANISNHIGKLTEALMAKSSAWERDMDSRNAHRQQMQEFSAKGVAVLDGLATSIKNVRPS